MQCQLSFLNVLHSFNLINRVDKPTHRLSNTLDLIIHDADSSIIPKIKVDRLFSDYNIIFFDISLPHTITSSKVKVYRKLKNINPDAFMKNIGEFCLSKPTGSSLKDKVNYYHSMLQTMLDIHAPIKSQKCSDCPRIAWFNQEIAEAIRLHRHLKRVWNRDKSNMEALTLFHCQCRLVSNFLDKAQQKFFLTSITDNSSNYKCIYEICNHLLGRSKDSPLPPGIPKKDLAVRSNNYFIQKIANIHTDLIEKHQHLPPYVERPAPPGTQDLSDFQPVTLPILHKIIQSTPNKNCDLDPVPTSLLKQILPSVIALIADIINSLLSAGIFPEPFKRALVRPLLKKPGLERNCRPVSNLGYVSKLVEHVVATQLVNHIERHGLMEAHQSAYHPFHSMETALLKVKSDVIGALEKQEVACLILLDLSVAFDTIDHDILLGRLNSRFAVTGTTLSWLQSYLTHRTQAVEIGIPLSGGNRSAFVPLESGIRQGSVLGPILFTMYTVPIGDTCRRHQVEFHLYADDTQIYLSFRPSKPNSKQDCTTRIEKCIEEIGIWMTQNLLKLNSDKTEFILFGT